MSKHFDIGTGVIYKNNRYEILDYTDAGMVLYSSERDETLTLNTYSMQWR